MGPRGRRPKLRPKSTASSRMKVPSRAAIDAATYSASAVECEIDRCSHYHCRACEITARSTIKTAWKKFASFTSSAFLRFQLFQELASDAAVQVHDVSLICFSSASRASTEAHMLHAVTICSRATATGAVSKGSSSFFTELMLAPHALVVSSRTTGRAADHGSSSRLTNHRFTTLRS